MKPWEYPDYLKAEGLKTVAEKTLSVAGRHYLGQKTLKLYAGGLQGRLEHPALQTSVAGIELENPVMVAAGWDKNGIAMRGFYHLGFSAEEIGTVVPDPQDGGKKPRLFLLDRNHSVALNRMKFNSKGSYEVGKIVESDYPYPLKLGLNVGRNAWTPNHAAPYANARVIRQLGSMADYIVLNLSSPNTADLRDLQDSNFIEELILSAREAMPKPVPLFIKIDGDREDKDIVGGVCAAVEFDIDGVIAINTSNNPAWKNYYGNKKKWQEGGLSGNDHRYRSRADQVTRLLYEELGGRIAIIGSGGISNGEQALDRIMAGASAIQVMTAIRSTKGKVAEQIKSDMLSTIQQLGLTSITDLVGLQTLRGVLPKVSEADRKV